MNVQHLIDECGSMTQLAARLGVSVQTVYTWKSRGIPDTRQSWIRERAPELVQAAQDRAGDTNGTTPA
jgi:transposase